MTLTERLLSLQIVAAQGIVTQPPTFMDGATFTAVAVGEYVRVYRNLTGHLVSVTIEATFAGTGEIMGVSQTDDVDGQVAMLKQSGSIITPALWVPPQGVLFMANLSGSAPPMGATFAFYVYDPLAFATELT